MQIEYLSVDPLDLPNPEWQDTIADDGDLIMHENMDGTFTTYVKSSTNVRLDFSLLMKYSEYLALRTYIKNAGSNLITLTWHDDDQYQGYFVTNPVTFSTIKRTYSTDDFDTEFGRIDLQFEGVKL